MATSADPYRITNKLEPSRLEVVAARLETRGRHALFARSLSDYLDRMDIDSKANVLDLGCGTGVATRAIARRSGFKGSLMGIDLSSHLVEAARRYAVEEKLGDRVQFETGDSHTLAIASGSFDAVVAHTLFSHLDDPAKVLAEMRRVLRPGGVIAIFDGDYASMTFELADEVRSRQMDDAIIASIVTNPRVLRQLPRQLKKAGFAVDTVLPSIITEVGTADFWKSGVESFSKLAPVAGVLTEAQSAAWLEELLAASARGEFFGSCVYYAYIGRPA